MERHRSNYSKQIFAVCSLIACSSLFGGIGAQRGTAPLASDLFSPPSPEKINTAPVVDGDDGDSIWDAVREYMITLNQGDEKVRVTIKSCRVDGRIFFMVRCPVKDLVEVHKVWHWDEKKQIYVPGDEEETSLTLLFYKDAKVADSADVWVWRAARNNIAGFADDMFLSRGIYSMDKGRSCWFSRFFGGFAGAELPRFYQRTPQGSASDVRAKGKLKDGILTVEFFRSLESGHSDDFSLNNKLLMKMIFQPGSR